MNGIWTSELPGAVHKEMKDLNEVIGDVNAANGTVNHPPCR